MGMLVADQSGNGPVGSRTVVHSLVLGSNMQSGKWHVGSRTVIYSLVMGNLVAEQ